MINLNECTEGDVLISCHGAKLKYLRPTARHEYLDHVVEYTEGEFEGSTGTRTDDGRVFKYNPLPTDHNIVEIIKQN